MTRHGRFQPQEKVNFDRKATFKRLVQLLKPYRWQMIVVFVFAILSTVFTIIGPKIIGQMTTKIFEGVMSRIQGLGGIDFTFLAEKATFLIGLYLLSSLFNFIQGFIITKVAQDLSFNLRADISSKIHRLPLKYFDTVQTGDVLSRVTNDVDTITQTLNQSLSQIITSVVSVVGILYMMGSISIRMTLIALIILPLTMLSTILVMKKSQPFFEAQQTNLGKVNGAVEEHFSGIEVIQSFQAEQLVQQDFQAKNEALYESGWKSQFLSGMMMPLVSFIGNLGYVLVTMAGAYFAAGGTIQVGDILAFVQYVRQFSQPLAQVAQISNILQSTLAASQRVFDFLDEEELEPEAPGLSENPVQGTIEFDGIQFGYDPEKPVITNFSAKIPAGSKVAIVGPTGAGKTTLVKLLMRFYELQKGRILMDGVDISSLQRAELRDHFGMVLQDTWLFEGSVKENIRYGDPEKSDEQVVEAADLARADHFIRTLPGSYDFIIEEDMGNLSQGQRQLITIARAILSQPDILILDEATSSVDTRTERLIQAGLENLMEGRTSFVIAHRLSTIRSADWILYMEHGNITEQGTHEDLMKKQGDYYNLYSSQFA